MKRVVCLLTAVLLLLSVFCLSVSAEGFVADSISNEIHQLRAGGGDSGGGSGGGGSGGGSGGSGTTHSSSGGSLIGNIIKLILFPFVAFSSAIGFYIKLSKRSRKAKKLIKQIQQSDKAWTYEELRDTVEKSYFAIQRAWSELDMTPAREYMSEKLFENYQTQLNWMKYRKEKNILENIQLLSALPVAVFDSADDSRDHVWFYIKGEMIDYKIDTETIEKLEGSTSPAKFVEYWQFIRNEDKWVLNQILQKNKEDKIAFCE